MLSVPLREFRRADGADGDPRITVNLHYLISVAPQPGRPDQSVVRITTGRGFEEYVILGSYDQVMAAVREPCPDDPAAAR